MLCISFAKQSGVLRTERTVLICLRRRKRLTCSTHNSVVSRPRGIICFNRKNTPRSQYCQHDSIKVDAFFCGCWCGVESEGLAIISIERQLISLHWCTVHMQRCASCADALTYYTWVRSIWARCTPDIVACVWCIKANLWAVFQYKECLFWKNQRFPQGSPQTPPTTPYQQKQKTNAKFWLNPVGILQNVRLSNEMN